MVFMCIYRNRKSNSFSIQSGRDWRWRCHTSARPSANQQSGSSVHSNSSFTSLRMNNASEYYPECSKTSPLPRSLTESDLSCFYFLSTVYSNDLILSPDWFSKLHTYKALVCSMCWLVWNLWCQMTSCVVLRELQRWSFYCGHQRLIGKKWHFNV